MSLESGKYTITSKLNNAPVGRRRAEHTDTRPKGIFKLPQDTAPDHVPIWEVEKVENGNYKLKAHHIVGDIGGRLFALLFEDHIASATTTEWTVTQDERDTEGNAYVVLAAGRPDGWTAPEGEDKQIVIELVPVGMSLPPTYLPRNVFIFKKVD